MKRTATLQRHTPLRPRSARKAQRDATWKVTRERILAANPICQGPKLLFDLLQSDLDPRESEAVEKALRGCSGRSTDVHHVQQRSVGGGNEDSNLLSLCRSCHTDFAHEHIDLAHRAGLLRRSWER